MEQLLFLTQRIPYPPDKGDKIRAWQILSHFAKSYRVHLGCFCDDPADLRHVPFLEGVCASLCCRTLSPKRAKLKSLANLGSGKPLTLGYFADAALRQWVDATVAANRPSRIFVFCSAMAPYALPHRAAIRILDMVDVDSDKWRQYAATKAWPASAIYARESRTLLAFERKIAGEFDATLLVSRAEADLFKRLAPELAARVMALPNGVDAAHFDPGRPYADPYPAGVRALCYTGAMDYWPNVDAVTWFAERVMPLLTARAPGLEFWIVGANPAPAVERLARLPAVRVTGRVDDVRPYQRARGRDRGAAADRARRAEQGPGSDGDGAARRAHAAGGRRARPRLRPRCARGGGCAELRAAARRGAGRPPPSARRARAPARHGRLSMEFCAPR